MRDWLADYGPVLGIGAVIVLLIGLLVLMAQSDSEYEHRLLAQARTFADTLQVQQIMEQRRLREAVSFGAGLVAGSAATRR